MSARSAFGERFLGCSLLNSEGQRLARSGHGDKMANSTLEPPGAAGRQAPPKPSLVQALRSIFSKTEDPDESRTVARRRRFGVGGVLGTLGVNPLVFLAFFFPGAL